MRVIGRGIKLVTETSMPVGSGLAPSIQVLPGFIHVSRNLPVPSLICLVCMNPLSDSSRGDRGFDLLGSAIVPLEQSPFPSGGRGMCLPARFLHLHEQHVSRFTADRNEQQAPGSCPLQGSIAHIGLSSSEHVRTSFTLSSLICQHREHALSILKWSIFRTDVPRRS